ncbi:MAG: hypothetical protein WA324_07025 [Bryobacteraceae bacterium]
MIDSTTEKPIDLLPIEIHPNNLPRDARPMGKMPPRGVRYVQWISCGSTEDNRFIEASAE